MAKEVEPASFLERLKGQKPKPLLIIGVLAVIAIIILVVVGVVMKQGRSENQQAVAVEYNVPARTYELKDHSYLKLSFSVVVDKDKVDQVKYIIMVENAGRLTNGIHKIAGDKTREALRGTYQRDEFAKEIQKMLEEQVFADYNRAQKSPKDEIKVREVLLVDFVTQGG